MLLFYFLRKGGSMNESTEQKCHETDDNEVEEEEGEDWRCEWK